MFAAAVAASAALARPAPVTPGYDSDVRPIFERHCVSCHGEKQQESLLRLDSRPEAIKGGMSGAVIVPGQSGESLLVQHVTGQAKPRMPHEKPPLSQAEIDVLVAWIDGGALGSEAPAAAAPAAGPHWGFVAPVRPPLPDVPGASHPIDRFVRARLVREGLPPSPRADKTTLLRRLSLDLVGLPPTIEEVDAFLKDASPDAWQRQVERLLASPHYGERWGRLWLDAARYADSDGFEKDKPRTVFFYRDWVVGALNRDLPYDQFVIEQVAGDLLEGATQDQRVATGFLRNSMVNEEGGIDPEQFRMEAMFDRMDAIGKSVLGLTVQCAQCHNHKFDPLRQEEYYRLFAFLNGSYEGSRAVYTPAEEMERARILRETREIEEQLQHRSPGWEERLAAWEDSVRGDQPEWTVLRPVVDDISTGGARYLPQPDGSLLQLGYAPTKHKVKLSWQAEAPVRISAFRLELLLDPDLPLGGPGRSSWGTGALTEFEAETVAPAEAGGAAPKGVPVRITAASADVEPPETLIPQVFDDKSGRRRVTGPVAYAIDGRDETAWGVDVGPGRRNVPRKAVFLPEAPIDLPPGATLNVYLKQNHGGWNSDDNQSYNLGRFRLSLTSAASAKADPLPAAVRDAIAVARAERTEAQRQAVFSYWRTTVPEWKDENARIASLWDAYPEGSSQLELQERGTPRATHVLKRGDFLKPTAAVGPGVPAFLHALPDGAPPNRLTFARWLVDRRSPTTARAAVNRVWQAYFGTGLVSTPEDFGRQGVAPSHPELLDWLAVEFMDRGFSLKQLHRTIVGSETYRQSSHVTQAQLARDPANRLLARGPRVRVDAEVVRDIALASSGLLNPALGGPSVYPPAPAFLFEPPVSYGPRPWPESKDADRYRRALYTFRYRSLPYPALATFDAPPGEVACVRRARTNTPLQALTTLNEPLFVEAARALARRTLEAERDDERRARYAFRRVLARPPDARETRELLALLRSERPRFSTGELNPWNLAANDPDKPVVLPKGTTMEELAAWTAVARVILNLDETITNQ